MITFAAWFFGIAITVLFLMFAPWPIWKEIKLGTAKNWSDEKIDARISYLLFRKNPFNGVELDALHEIQEKRMNKRMKEYGKQKWSEYK